MIVAAAIDIASTCSAGIINSNVFVGFGVGEYIAGTLITNAGTQFMDTLRVSGNIPVAADWTSRMGTETTSTSGAGAPPVGGGGEIWVDGTIPAAGADFMLDDSINWKDRYIVCQALFGTALPGGVDGTFVGWQIETAVSANADFNIGAMYTRAGGVNMNVAPYIIIYEEGVGPAAVDYIRLWVDVGGSLRMGVTNNGGGISAVVFMLHISYSPDQGKY